MLLNTVDLESDLYITEGILDVLDHSAPDPLFGGKLGIDATRRAPGERPRGTPSPEFPGTDPKAIAGALGDVSPHLRQFYVPNLNAGNPPLLISLKKDGTISGRSLADPLLRHPALSAFSIIVIYDEALDLRDASLLLWKVFNNVDPKRDLVREKNRIVIDATRKGPEDDHYRPWPDDIVMHPEVVERVKRRGKELGIEAFL